MILYDDDGETRTRGWDAKDSLPATERALTLPLAGSYEFVSVDPVTSTVTLADPNGTRVEFVPKIALKDAVAIADDQGISLDESFVGMLHVMRDHGVRSERWA